MVSPLRLTVSITYKGIKAQIEDYEEALKVVRKDLTSMGAPHPKRSNFQVLSPGRVRFFWTALPNSAIHKTLKSRFKQTTENYDDLRSMRDKRSIATIFLAEAPEVGDARLVQTGKPHAGKIPTGPSQESGRDGWMHQSNLPTPSPTPAAPFAPFSDSKAHEYERLALGSAGWSPKDQMSIPIPMVQAEGRPLKRARYDDEGEDRQYHHSIDLRPSIQERKPFQWNEPSAPVWSEYPPPMHGLPPKPVTLLPMPTSPSPASLDVQGIRRQLRDVRWRLNLASTRERELLALLHTMGFDDADVKPSASDDWETKARIQHLESELESERALRRDAEALVDDIRKECQHPFVVPSLLDAFVDISMLSLKSLRH